MTVKKLIELLEGFDPDKSVQACIRDGEQVRGVRMSDNGQNVLLLGTNRPDSRG